MRVRRSGHGRGPEPGEAAGQNLMGRASSALLWAVINALASRLGTVAIGIALARLLGPEQMGTYAVALLALMAALSFNELGVSLAIVRWRGDPEAIAPTVATLSVLSSLVIATAGVCLAPALSVALGDEAATPVLQLLFGTVLISGLVATPAALLQREFRQRVRTLVDQITIWVGALVSVALAVIGYGAISLAVGRVVGVAVSCLLFFRAAPEGFRFGWDRSSVGPLLRFGLPLAGASIAVFAIGFVDQIVTTRVLGATALAFYVMAGNLASWPVSVFSAPLRNVAPATFARLQHDPGQASATLSRSTGLLAAVALPVCLVLAGAADPVIRLVYGQAWVPAAEPLLWLAVFAGFRILFELAYDYVVVLGGSRALMLLQLVWFAVLVPALLLGSNWGTAGIAAAQVAVAAAVMVPLYAFVLQRVGVPLPGLVRRLGLPIVASAGAGTFAWWVCRTVGSDVVAAAVSALGGCVVLATLLWRNLDTVREVRGTAPSEPSSGKATT